MIRGSTPTHYFTDMPFGSDSVKKVIVTYAQNGEIILEKTESDVSWEGNTMVIKLTQDETLLFNEEMTVQIQLKVMTNDDAVIPSHIMSVPCGRVLNDEVMT